MFEPQQRARWSCFEVRQRLYPDWLCLVLVFRVNKHLGSRQRNRESIHFGYTTLMVCPLTRQILCYTDLAIARFHNYTTFLHCPHCVACFVIPYHVARFVIRLPRCFFYDTTSRFTFRDTPPLYGFLDIFDQRSSTVHDTKVHASRTVIAFGIFVRSAWGSFCGHSNGLSYNFGLWFAHEGAVFGACPSLPTRFFR